MVGRVIDRKVIAERRSHVSWVGRLGRCGGSWSEHAARRGNYSPRIANWRFKLDGSRNLKARRAGYRRMREGRSGGNYLRYGVKVARRRRRSRGQK